MKNGVFMMKSGPYRAIITYIVCIAFSACGTLAQTAITLPTLKDSLGHRHLSRNIYAVADYDDPYLPPNLIKYTYASEDIPNNDTESKLNEIWIASGENLWVGDSLGSATNRTQAGGTTGLMRGSKDAEAVFYINHRLSGRIYAYGAGTRANLTGSQSTTVIGKDDPSVSRIDGKVAGTRVQWNGYDDNAVSIIGRRTLGGWTFKEGNYFGGEGFSGGYFETLRKLEIQGASFIAGDQQPQYLQRLSSDLYENTPYGHAPSGLYVNQLGETLTISNRTGIATDRFQAGSYGQNVETLNQAVNGSFNRIGGDGLTAVQVSGKTLITGGDFIGSQQTAETEYTVNAIEVGTRGQSVFGNGGHGVLVSASGVVDVEDGRYFGGDAVNVNVAGPDGTIETVGGSGLLVESSGAIGIHGGYFEAGRSGQASITAGSWTEVTENSEMTRTSDENGRAIAMGGAGIRILNNTGTTTISGDVVSYGGNGSIANASALAEASGGAGLLAENSTVIVNGGTYYGGRGGTASGEGEANAYGGAGAYVTDKKLTINGGTFTGGADGSANGVRQMGNIGVWAQNANLEINQTSAETDTLINGDVLFNNTSAKTLAITGGTIEGDIYKYGEGKATVSVDTTAKYSGSFSLMEGDADINLTDESQGAFFSNVDIGADSTMAFVGSARAVTATGSRFTLGGANSSLTFTQGAELSSGTSISAGYGTVQTTSGSDLIMRDGSSVTVSLDSLSGGRGLLDVSGTLVVSNNSKIVLSAISATPVGSVKVADAAAVEFGGNDVEDIVDVDVGWLNKQKDAVVSSGIRVDYEYNSLTNSSLNDLDDAILTALDTGITNASPGVFYNINAQGEDAGTKMMRYTVSQLPEVADIAFQTQSQVANQIAARGTEFRSMNGFASTKPRFNRHAAPQGVAGPEAEDSGLQGWIRAYGAFGSKSEDSSFASYDAQTFGSVIGIDKSFGNLLVGLAGGFAAANLDADDAYTADTKTYHGSVYATFGGESAFMDLALTYGMSDTEEKNAMMDGEFDSDILAAYIGVGKTFGAGENLAITPELSFLASTYNQSAYRRNFLNTPTLDVNEYDAESYLGSIGVNVATKHQIDWLNRGIAAIPEFRIHWLHEFNPDLDDFSYIVAGNPYTFGVRPRDEDLLKVGLGFDVWSWRHQSAKFEVDYDGLFSDTYAEHILSGKVTFQF